MATPLPNETCCQPLADSLVNVAVARRLPWTDHRLPMCVPVLVVSFQKRTPVIQPSTSDWNLTPSSTELLSLVFCVAGPALLGQIVHGQLPGTAVGVDVGVLVGVLVGVAVFVGVAVGVAVALGSGVFV